MANDGNQRRVNNRYKVVIIGAGISAFGAANDLCSEGFDDIAILEATNRIGGRIWSIDLGRLFRSVCLIYSYVLGHTSYFILIYL